MHRFKGAIIAHIGPMFGGKTSALLADIRKMKIAKYKTVLFKPTIDKRYSKEKIVNHDGESMDAIRILSVKEIISYIQNNDVDVIAIDEFQFVKPIDNDIQKTIKLLVDLSYKNNKTIIISGLDLDSDLNPFDMVQAFLPYCTHIFKHKAVCVCCGNDATLTYCKINKKEQNLIGGKDIYEPRCTKCYIKDSAF